MTPIRSNSSVTVIILARASNGVVVAADGRTCIGSPPEEHDDNAQKVRVHRTGSGGLVTASSGRATFGTNKTIAEVIDVFWNGRTAAGAEVAGPRDVAEYLRSAVAKFNLTQTCTCGSNYGECVQVVLCEECGFDSKPGCEFKPRTNCRTCHGVSTYEWIDSESCPCSPGGGKPDSVPSVHTGPGQWCHCKALAEDPIALLCVPFGPQYPGGYEEPSRTVIGPNHQDDVVIEPVQKNVLVEEELIPKNRLFDPRARIISETVTRGHALGACLTDLDDTVEKARSLLRIAYDEAQHNAVLRKLKDSQSFQPKYDPEALGMDHVQKLAADDEPESVTIQELANAIRRFEKSRGVNVNQEVGVPSIGGRPTYVRIDENGNASGPDEIEL